MKTEAEKLRIVGLVPFSTVDWPGKIAASLFLQGCPWRCPYCHNAEILDARAPGTVGWDQVQSLMTKRVGLLDGVVFSGGEALLQATNEGWGPLETAMAEVKDQGFQVGLHTGGAYPKRLAHLLDLGLVDWVGLDVKATPERYQLATGSPAAAAKAEAALGVLADFDAARGKSGKQRKQDFSWEVRLTLWPGLLSGEERTAEALLDYAREVAAWSRDRGARSFALQRYRKPQSEAGLTALSEGPHWDEQEAARILSDVGFSQLSFR